MHVCVRVQVRLRVRAASLGLWLLQMRADDKLCLIAFDHEVSRPSRDRYLKHAV